MAYKLEEEPIWTHDQVIYLNNRQHDGSLHPYTCGKRSDHPVYDGDQGVLVATVYGWICPFCDYSQTFITPHDERMSTNQRIP